MGASTLKPLGGLIHDMSLQDRIKEAIEGSGKTQAEIAREVNASEGAVTQWLNGTTKSLKAKNATALEMATGYSATWIVTGKGPRKPITAPAIELEDNPDFPAVRRVRIKVVGGITGYAVEYQDEDDGPPIVFRRDWYTSNGFNPAKMLAMRVTGESMVPNLRAGDLIIINTEQTQPKDGVAFVVSYEGEPVVKRLVRDQGEWWLTSDNSDQRRFPRKRCDENATLIGEVVYRQTEHI